MTDKSEKKPEEHIMTEAEVEALRDKSNRNPPKIPVRQLREKALDELTQQAQDLDMGY